MPIGNTTLPNLAQRNRLVGISSAGLIISGSVIISGSANTITLSGASTTQTPATQTFVTTQVSNLVDSAPGTLDTLNELAAAIGDDANFATTISTALGNRLRVDTASQGLTSTQQGNARTNLGLGTAATSAASAFQTALTNPVTGTGTTNYLTKFTGTSAIGNSQIYDTGTIVTVGGLSNTGNILFQVNGTARVAGILYLGSTINNGTHTYTLPSATGTLALTSNLASYVPTSRTITINGTTLDLSQNRSWTISESDTLATVTGRGATTTNDITVGGLTVGGSLSYGSYTDASNYVTGADNILLKGNASGVSGIFFESEKNGTNINHASDFGFIQYHAYGIGGSSGEANRLVIGVSNDSDDLIVLNPVTSNGAVIRIGAGTTEYPVWHAGNDGASSGLDADLLDGQHGSYYYAASNPNGYIAASYLDDYTRGAYRVISDYSGDTTWYIRSNGQFIWARGHDWSQSFRLNLPSGAVNNSTWAYLGQQNSNDTNGIWRGVSIIKYASGASTAGDLQANGVYAQTLYDDNDTNYYVNPASTSNLVGLTVANTITGNISGNAAGSSRFINIGTVQSITNLNMSLSDTGAVRFDTFQQAASNKPVTGNNANGVITFTTNHGSAYGKQLAFVDNDDLYIRRITAGSYASWRKLLHEGNYSSYALPLGGGTMTGNIAMGGYSITGADGYTGTNFIASNAFYLNGTSTFLNYTNGRVYSNSGFESATNIVAPIYYDSSNTGYHWDPNSDNSHRFTTPSGYIDIGPKNGSYCHIYTDRTSFYFNKQLDVLGDRVWNAGNAPRAGNNDLFYYQGFTLDANTMNNNASGFTYSVNAPFTGPIMKVGEGSYYLQFNAPYSGGGNRLAFRTRNGDTGTLNAWQYPAVYGVNVNGGGALYATSLVDTDNTNYYVDPASSTYLNNLTATEIYANNWFRNNGSNEGLYNQSTTQHWSSNTNGYWDVSSTTNATTGATGIRLYAGGHVNTLRGYLYSDGDGFGLLNNQGGWSVRANQGTGYGGSLYGNWTVTNLTAANRIESSGPSGGTYFYDVDDTNFYFDGSEPGDSIRVAGDIVAYYSDDRLKTRLGNIENAVDKVKTLNGFYYEPNDTAQKLGYNKKVEVGVSAQEVEQILPELIKQAPIDAQYKTIDYARLTPLLIEAIKEQQQQIDELKQQINLILNK